MTMGLTSKVIVFMIVMNTFMSFVGNSGFLGSGYETDAMYERAKKFRINSQDAVSGIDLGVVGTVLQAVFNPILYIIDLLGIVLGFFADPIIFAGSLASPFAEIAGSLFAGLQATAIISVIRGVAA